jgi:hypothetical protein
VSVNKRELVEKTIELLASLDIPPHPIEDQASRTRFFYKGGYSIGLRDQAVDTLEVAVRLISESPEYKYISIKKIEDEYIQSLINLLMLDSMHTQYTIKTEINGCLERLIESIEERRVLIPIESFRLIGIPELKIGNVRFIEFDSIHEKMKCDIYELIDHNPTIPQEKKDLNKKHLEKGAIEPFADKVCAEITVNSEVEKSYSNALHEAENAINLLRCYIPLLFPRGLKVQIGIYGGHDGISAGKRSLLSLKTNGGLNCTME